MNEANTRENLVVPKLEEAGWKREQIDREFLDYFNTAYNLGMTATPKREDNIDVYEYFGRPVFEYSLAQAIEDGFLVPYKIYKINTNIDKNGLIVDSRLEITYDDEVDIENIKSFYLPSEFERTITLPDRTELMSKRFLEILKNTDEKAKTIIFVLIWNMLLMLQLLLIN